MRNTIVERNSSTGSSKQDMKLDKDSASVRLKLIGMASLLVCVAVSLLPTVGRAQQSNAPKRILVLYWYGRDYPGHVMFDQSFQAALQSVPARVG